MKRLTDFEEKGLAYLTSYSVETTLIETTETGLGKSILDATAPVRRYLYDKGVHDYEGQRQGPDSKKILNATLMLESIVIPSRASLYRPNTKKGDPRIWFRKLTECSKANDVLAIIAHNKELFVINLSSIPLEKIIENKEGPIWDLLQDIKSQASSTSDELLGKLRVIAQKGPLRSVIGERADTAVGRTLETALGININSRREPDYKGIELKSFRQQRAGRETRKTLFAKVPNWEISKFSSSREILDTFGYDREGDFKLYCTISAKTSNSQGLKFEMDSEQDILNEVSDNQEIGAFASWVMDDLRKSLREKHNETFWISAESSIEDNIEYFQFKKVLHTKKPITSQFEILLEQGGISMDHLIKRTSTGGAKEKGPLFKINTSDLSILFPPPKTYDLLKENVYR